ncbi:MAG TPA: tetraacyldisaccharide 4'-kinase [Rhabdochlamydiaceae bacterium]|jgi:tetraacyldisaccharide 4'-kinase
MPLANYFFNVIAERRPSPSFVRGGLRALSYLFRAGIELRALAYAKKILPSFSLPAAVISVGNIAVGGTGKTPFVRLLARQLQGACRLAILSRGFHSQMERSPGGVKVASAGNPFFSPEECGDEPYFLGQETLADVWVGRDRVASGHKAIQEGAQCLILDDGMQHRRLARDFELVVVDGKDPLARGNFLPRGLLRDLPVRLKEAHLIIANHVEDDAHLETVRETLKNYTRAPLLGVRAEAVQAESIKGKRAGVYCGIGRPERFVEMLRALGVKIVDALFLMDHSAVEQGQLQRFAQSCKEKGADCLLCTAKDWVKWPSPPTTPLPVHPVNMELKICAGKEHWDALLQSILTCIAKKRDTQ